MSETQLERWGIGRVAGAITVLSELVVVGVVLFTFADDSVMLAAGALWVLVSAPVLYVVLAKTFGETVRAPAGG